MEHAMDSVTYLWECGEEACAFCLSMEGEHVTEPTVPAHEGCECSVTVDIEREGTGKGYHWRVVMRTDNPKAFDWISELTIYCDGSDEPHRDYAAEMNPSAFSTPLDFYNNLARWAETQAKDVCNQPFLCC
jgi:hypothetical protein